MSDASSSTAGLFDHAVREQRAGRFAQAEKIYRDLLARDPAHTDSLHLLGLVLHQMDRPGAEDCIRRAIAIKPHAFYFDNLGNVLREQERYAEAAGCYAQALALQPDHAEAHYNLAHTLLTRGDFDRGLAEYEWRWQTRDATPPRPGLVRPAWDGGALGGRTLLLLSEQGIGDTLQCARYVPLLRAREPGARLVVECQPPIRDLLRRSFPMCRVLGTSEALPPYDEHCSLLSLPHRLGTRLETIPARVPYLTANAQKSRAWRQRLRAETDDLKIGLAWAGSPGHPDDRKRSVPLAAFAPLAGMPRVAFYSLQKGGPAAQARQPPGFRLTDVSGELHDFDDTAALVANLHLVISVDTAVAHLAGALGRPVWTLLRFAADWRWLTDREDSPWYPTMRLFRQREPGNWAEVMRRVAESLCKLAEG